MGSGGSPRKACVACGGLGTEKHNRCPESMSTPFAHQIVSLAAHYRRGYLPSPGGMLDQGARVMDLVSIATAEMDSIEGERRTSEKPGG